MVSLSHNGRRVVLGHMLKTQTLMETDEQEKVLNKLTILCWASIIVILGCTHPTGCGLDTPAGAFRKEHCPTDPCIVAQGDSCWTPTYRF